MIIKKRRQNEGENKKTETTISQNDIVTEVVDSSFEEHSEAVENVEKEIKPEEPVIDLINPNLYWAGTNWNNVKYLSYWFKY